MARWQLLELGFSSRSIERRIANGRVHPVRRGVYALGRPELTRYGHWMAAILSCGSEAMLSHESAAALWGIRSTGRGQIHVSVSARHSSRQPGIKIHRRANLVVDDVTTHRNIAVTTPVRTLIDLARRIPAHQLEAAINEADKLELTDPETLREALEERAGQPGVAILRELLDRRTFRLTDSELERRFLPLARKAGLPPPLTQQTVNGFRVDFYWPELGLVVETDGLRYHRTPAQQARDRRRDQIHTAAGLTPLRFTHPEVRFEARHVQRTLTAVARRLSSPT